jgi:poly(3-hydroxybutyrate) depolymerase
MMKWGAAALWLCLAWTAQATPELKKETFEATGQKRSYYLFIPETIDADQPAPVVLMLHGSYSDGRELTSKWIDIANRDGLILVGPNALDSTRWQIRADSPEFMRDVIDDVAKKHRIDRRRMYLFGHSGGAVYALTLGMLESEYFAGVAIYAGAWQEKSNFEALTAARRKIPVLVMVGDKDQFFPISMVRKTVAALEQAGHPVTLIVFKGHGHSYEDLAPRINRATWEFLKPIELEVTPHFQSYG